MNADGNVVATIDVPPVPVVRRAIQRLEEAVVNRIAAGEIIQRPGTIISLIRYSKRTPNFDPT